MNPTKEQQAILDTSNNLVIVASPGSGKTFVISEKIKRLLPQLNEHRGVIAISYTNKASQELQKRCLLDGISPKSSFFGTMDKFYLSEIIIPFGKQLFGVPKNEVAIVKMSDLQSDVSERISALLEDIEHVNDKDDLFEDLIKLFLNGTILLDTVGLLSVYIFDRSKSCQNYIRARYSHIFIDEYQDCGREQHWLFLRIAGLGLTAVAVGDANQSIFKFSGKSADFLMDLAANVKDFDLYPLDINHRCHPSIVNYSLLLLNEEAVLSEVDQLRVCEKKVDGSEVEVAQWVARMIPKFSERFKISDLSKIGVLVRGNNAGGRISENIGIPHKLFETTLLDEDFTIWSELFRQLLAICFDKRKSRSDFLDSYIDISVQKRKAKSILSLIDGLTSLFLPEELNIDQVMLLMERIAFEVSPLGYSSKSLGFLRTVLTHQKLLNSYRPAAANEVQIMTLHKSKGLEFDVVFHLDLYKYILPNPHGDRMQDLNLHYVGVTRAKECCVLVHSTLRTISRDNRVVQADPSEFLEGEKLKTNRSFFDR